MTTNTDLEAIKKYRDALLDRIRLQLLQDNYIPALTGIADVIDKFVEGEAEEVFEEFKQEVKK